MWTCWIITVACGSKKLVSDSSRVELKETGECTIVMELCYIRFVLGGCNNVVPGVTALLRHSCMKG